VEDFSTAYDDGEDLLGRLLLWWATRILSKLQVSNYNHGSIVMMMMTVYGKQDAAAIRQRSSYGVEL
jgi:hypothetical protein